MGYLNDLKYLGRALSVAFRNRPSQRSMKDRMRTLANNMFRRGETYGMRKEVSYSPAGDSGVLRNDWPRTVRSATSIIREDFHKVCARAEMAYRTDALCRRAVNMLVSYIVGQGLKPYPNIKTSGGISVDGANKQLADDWERFNDEAMRAGAGVKTIYEGQRVKATSIITYGSILQNVVRSKSGSMLPFAFQLVKPTRLDFSRDTYVTSNMTEDPAGEIIHGMRMDAFGDPINFYFEGEDRARSADFIDLSFMPIEAEQYLGMSWLLPVLPAIFDRQQLLSDKLKQSRIGARLGIQMSKDMAPGVSDLLETDDSGNSFLDLDFQGLVFSDGDIKPIAATDPIEKSFEPLIRMIVQEVALGMFSSYQRLSTDLKDANFTSGRINTLQDDKLVKVLIKQMADVCFQKDYNRFVEWEVLTGRLERYGVGPDRYYRDAWRYNQCYWLPKDKEGWVDPLKDMQALDLERKIAGTTLQEICSMKGSDWRSKLSQLNTEIEEIKKYNGNLDFLIPGYADNIQKENVNVVQEDTE